MPKSSSAPPERVGPILLIDDEPFVLQMMSRALTQAGFEVVTAQGGLDGIKRARQVQPPIVLTDLTMPTVDGLGVCQYLKNDPELKKIYVVVVTARTREEDRQRAAQAGADEYLTKPFGINALAAHLHEVLAQRASTAA